MPIRPPIFKDPARAALLEQWRRQRDRARGTPAERGYGPRWQAYARRFIQMHPWCQCERCQSGGSPLRAEHVDHVIAVSGPGDPLFWHAGNHRAMSHSCHSRKTVEVDGGLGRERRNQVDSVQQMNMVRMGGRG